MVFTLVSTIVSHTISNFIQPALEPVSNMLNQAANYGLPYRPIDPTSAIEARKRGIIDTNLYHQYMRRQGYNHEAADRMFEASKNLMQANELVVAKWREIITNTEYYKLGDKLGFDNLALNRIEKISRFYPSIQDFIRFMVRESFDESVVKKYEYDSDYPEAINKLVEKAGIDAEWMKHYWRSHWQLPAVNQGYEMLHRGVIQKEELEDLLRIGDIPKYWRDKLIAISYKPYTRVDVRRMHKSGVLSVDDVFKSYKDLGYDDEKAGKMTDFTIDFNLEKPKSIAETKIQESFMNGKLNDVDALSMLKQLGYDNEGSDFLIELWKNDLENNDVDIQIEIIKRDYLFGDIDESGLTGKLGQLNLPSKSVDIIRNNIELDRSNLRRLPTKSDFTRWFNSKLLNESDYKEHLKSLGYGEIYIDNYVKETKIGGTSEFRLPTKKEILNWLKKDIIKLEDWINIMFALGYSDQNIIRYAADYGLNLDDLGKEAEVEDNGISEKES